MTNEKEVKNLPVLDLVSINIPLRQISRQFNGKKPLKSRFTGRFEDLKNPPDLRGLILKALIYQNYQSLEKFAKKVQKDKSWVWMLLYTPEKCKITYEIEMRMQEAFGIQIKLMPKIPEIKTAYDLEKEKKISGNSIFTDGFKLKKEVENAENS